jgi:hypothetical protein
VRLCLFKSFPSLLIPSAVGVTADSDRCWELLPDDAGVHLRRCDPAITQQWFTLGPCIDETNITIPDGSCPVYGPEEADRYCQIQSIVSTKSSSTTNAAIPQGINSHEKEKIVCLDIYGQSPQPGAHLIGYECLGQWNQLFRIMSDCTISAMLPEPIGRVRGFDKNITLCLESKLITGKGAGVEVGGLGSAALKHVDDMLMVVTGECADNVAQSNANHSSEAKPSADGSVEEGSLSSKYARELLRKKQTFEFVHRGGAVHMGYVNGVGGGLQSRPALTSSASSLSSPSSLSLSSQTIVKDEMVPNKENTAAELVSPPDQVEVEVDPKTGV